MVTPQVAFAGAIFAQEGYTTSKQSNLLSLMDNIDPYGDTAMLDAMCVGIKKILRINAALSQINMQNVFNFLHIIITDGVDNQSRASLESVMAIQLIVGRTLPVSRCKTFIIGIDLDQDQACRQQLQALNAMGGENCAIIDIDSVDIGTVFERIQISLGIQQQTSMAMVSQSGVTAMQIQQTNRPVMMVRRNNFAVLFNLDVSGSMSGTRWERVKASVSKFLDGLGDSDLVTGICFNGDVMGMKYAADASQARKQEDQGTVIISTQCILS